MSIPEHAVQLLDRLERLGGLAAGPRDEAVLETLSLLTTLGRCAFDTAPGSANYARSGLATLGALHEVQKKALLMRLSRLRRPSPALTRLADGLELGLSAEGDFLRPAQRMALGLWLGRGAEALGLLALETDTADLALETVELFVTHAHPEDDRELETALSGVSPMLMDMAFTLWCERAPAARLMALDDIDGGIAERVAALSLPLRLRTAVTLLERGAFPRELAHELIASVEPDWKTPRDNAERAIADARLAAVVGAAGDTASAEGLLWHANAGLDRENNPARRGDIFEALFKSTAILATAPLGGPGAGSWLSTLDRLQRDKVVLRQRDALFLARQAAITTLPRAAQAGQMLADRGHEALKDLGRKIPERWLELLHLAVATRVWRHAGRDPETHLSLLADLLRRDGLPSPDARVELAPLISHLAVAVPNRLVDLGERIAEPISRAVWWSTALLVALP